jgi:hypothetical protein
MGKYRLLEQRQNFPPPKTRQDSIKISALPHFATTGHGERTCYPIFRLKHLPDIDLKPFFISKLGKKEKLKIGQEKLFYVLSILCFRETRNRKKG